MKNFLKVVSLAMVFALLIQVMPMNMIADAVKAPESEISSNAPESNIKGERKDLRDKYTKVFEREDGTYTAVVSASPIHFEEDNEWQDIDNSLIESIIDGKAVLKNTDNSFTVEFPKSISDSDKTVKVEKDGYTLAFTVDDVKTSLFNSHIDSKTEKTVIDNSTSDAQKASKLEKKSATVKYESIKEGVDFEYSVLPDSVKENIILTEEPEQNAKFCFTISAPDMTAVLLEDNSIEFYDTDKETVFILPAPFMFDDNAAYSGDIKVKFDDNKDGTFILTYVPSKEWLHDSGRSYPIIIDPVVSCSSNCDVYDTYISDAANKQSTNYGNMTYATIGNKSDGSYWTYISSTGLWASKAVVSKATLNVYAVSETAQPMTITAKVVTGSWEESSLTYNNRPANETLPIDCGVAPINSFGQISFDITQALPISQDCFGGGLYQWGVMLSAYDSSMNSAQIYSSENSNTQYVPVIEYSFVETTGHTDKFEYHTQNIGRAGTASVNDFTGGMYLVRDEIGIDGNIMPVNIQQYYSVATADLRINAFSVYFSFCFEDYGRVWLTNYHRFVGCIDDYYVDENGNLIDLIFYIDGTGAITYFKKTETVSNGMEKWVEQYDKTSTGKGLTMWVPELNSLDDYDYEGIIVEESSGETMTFEECGRLATITAAPNENITGDLPTIQIDYKEGNQALYYMIDKITDGVGREYRFSYDSSNLTTIQAFDAQNNAITVGSGSSSANLQMTYTYNGVGKLTTATYPDGESVSYSYTECSIESATDINGYRISYDYDDHNAVTQITESTLDSSSTRVTGNVVDITYDSPYQRTYEDSYDNIEVAQFDNYGRKIGTYNDEGQYKRTTYEDIEIDNATYNLLSGSSYIQEQKDNILLNSSFESGSSNWSVVQGSSYSPGVDSTVKYTGSNSYKMNCTSKDTIGIVQSFTNLDPGNYTFSAYVKVPNAVGTGDDGAKISIETKNSGGTTVEHIASNYVKNTGTAWERLNVNINVTASTPTVNVYLWLYNSTGIACFDNAKLELGDMETPYNVLQNSKMSSVTNNLPNNWTGTNLTSSDIATTETKFEDTVNVMKITGSPNTQKSISQSFSVSGGADDIIDVGCWTKAKAVDNGGTGNFRLRIEYYNTTLQQTETETVDFIPYVDYWQFVTASIPLSGACTSITLYLDYDNQINTAYFTDVRVAYTDVVSGGASSQEDDTPTYCVCGEEHCVYGLGCDCPCESEETCTCLQCHETTTNTYDSMGNLTSTIIDNGTKEMVTGNSYTTDKNYLASAVNSAGSVVEYGYNTANGTLTNVTDSLDSTVEYTYNAMCALAGVSQTVSNLSTGTALTNTYEYEDDRLTGIAAGNNVDYSFEYGLWGYQTGVNIGTQNFVDYTYGTGENCDRIASVSYGNGQTITYSYDSCNNVTGISYDGGSTWSYTYAYSATNGLTSVTDNVSDQITYYTDKGYDIYTIPQTGQGILLYSSSYDEDDNFVQTANGYIYTYVKADDTNDKATGVTVSASTVSSSGTSLALSSSTDFFGRPVNRTIGVKDGTNNLGSVSVEYTYQDGTGDRTTEYVGSYKNVVTPTTGTATDVEYTYTYDANGNILTTSLGGTLKYSYVYDQAGQLVRVNDAVQNKTFVNIYDNGGNLTSKVKYAYTTGTNLGTAEQTSSFSYNDSNWKDKLTAYSGSPLTYDAIGNLTAFSNRTYTWTAGRQLAQFTFSQFSLTIDFKYNTDGHRTQKIVDNGYFETTTTYDYVWADGKLVSQTDGTDVLYFLYDSNDSPIGFVLNDSATYLYIKNLQGDITGIADENGAIIVSYTYNEWGMPTSVTGSEAGTIGELNPLRYRGYYYDNDLGLGIYYLQSRYYSPSWGRFINADDAQVLEATQGDVFGSNLSAYCCNDAINTSDHTGYWGPDVHYGCEFVYDSKGNREFHPGTHEWARQCKYTHTQADIIAEANKSVDTNALTGPINIFYGLKYHFNRGGSTEAEDDTRLIIFFEKYEEAIIKWKANKTDKALKLLGQGFHSLQDYSAHGNWRVNQIMLIHPDHFDDVAYDWKDNNTRIAVKKAVNPTTFGDIYKGKYGDRYMETRMATLLFLYSFRTDVGLPTYDVNIFNLSISPPLFEMIH